MRCDADWTVLNANDFCLRVTDGTHDSPKKTMDGKFLITSRHLNEHTLDYSNAYRISGSDFEEINRRSGVDRWDILISMIGTVGEVYMEKRMALDYAIKNVGLFKLGGDEVRARWLYYYLKSPKARSYIRMNMRGSTQQYIPLGALRAMPIPYPTDAEKMERIVATLSCLDDKIELNNRMNKNLEEMAQALFKSWFVDFDPVKAKMEGREPAGMDAETAALFPDEFEDSKLGPIPKGWRVGVLGEATAAQRVNFILSDIGGNYPYVGLEHIGRKHLMLESWGSASEVSSQKSAFRRGNILFGKLRPYFHKVAIAPVDGICSTDILVFDANDDWYCYSLGHLFSSELVDYATRLSQGTRMPRVNLRDIVGYKVALPRIGVAATFSRLTSPLVSQMLFNASESKTLATLRDTLLPKLMSGAIRVPEAEDILEEVL